MTYPPQPPQGGQSPWPGRPGVPGMHQTGGQQYGQPYGMLPSPPGEPPKKRKTGLIVGLSVGGLLAVGLVAFLVTGFLTPGFLLDDDSSAARPTTPFSVPKASDPGHAVPNQSAPPLPSQNPNVFASAVIKDINGGDIKSVVGKYCSRPADYTVEDVEGVSRGGAKLRLAEKMEADDAIPMADIEGTVNGNKIDSLSSIMLGQPKNGKSGWCIKDLLLSPPDVKVKDARPEAKRLVPAVNSRDVRALLKKSCKGAGPTKESLEYDLKKNPQVSLGQGEAMSDRVDFTLKGKIGRKSLDSGSSLKLESADAGKTWCVDDLFLIEQY